MKTGIWIPIGFAITVIGSAAHAQTVPAGSPTLRGNTITMPRTTAQSLPVIQQPYGFLVFDPRTGRWLQAMFGPTTGNVNPTVNPTVGPVVNPVVNPNFNPAVNPVVNPGVNPAFNPQLNANVAPQLPRVNTMNFTPGNTLARLQNIVAQNVPVPGGGVNLLANQLNTNTFPGAFNLPQNTGVVNPLVNNGLNNGFIDANTINGQNAVNNGFNGSAGFINPVLGGTVIANGPVGLARTNFGVVANGQFSNIVDRTANFGGNLNAGFVSGRNMNVPAGSAAPMAVGGFGNFNTGGNGFNGFVPGRNVTVPAGMAAPLGGRAFR